MPLVQIEVSNFKSYRGHQVIGPFRNFTSVIGPNGAGKSNLMDAISFVLGVKSAQLRSTQLKDLIYRGRRLIDPDDTLLSSDLPDPDGEDLGDSSAQEAWVLALYEAEDKRLWKFQRTVTMAGHSDYKLNDEKVAYSVYNAALVSHNILVKARNFLVFQGDVEAVASQSASKLAKLIDQISGSLELAPEYEKARETQATATENATYQFTKRKGINGEIRQYREQKEEAGRFEDLLQKRDDLILARVLYKLYHVEENIENNIRSIRANNKKLEALQQDRQAQQTNLQNFRSAAAQNSSAFSAKQKSIRRAEKALDNKTPEIAEVDAQLKHSDRKLDNITRTNTQVKKENVEHVDRLARLERELVETKRDADAAQLAARNASEQQLSLSQDSLTEYTKLRSMASVLAVNERQTIETVRREAKAVSRTAAQLKQKQSDIITKRDRLQSEVSAQKSRKAELEEKLFNLQHDMNKSKKEYDSQQEKKSRVQNLEKETNEKLAEVYRRLLDSGVDKQMSEKQLRFRETLANLQKIFPGVRGRLRDLCRPIANQYKTAFAVVLGRDNDSVVVDNESTAIECIEYMRNQRAGTATFIPLDTIKVKPVNDKYRGFAKGARLAVDVMEFSPAIEKAVIHACGNAVVCDTMEIARKLCYDQGQEIKAVTLDGTIIHRSGLITGGRGSSRPEGEWDEQNYIGLQRTKDQLLHKLAELRDQSVRGKTSEEIIAEVQRLENLITVMKDDLNDCVSKLDGHLLELNNLEQQLKADEPSLLKAQQTLKDLETRVQELQVTISVADDGVFKDFCTSINVANIREYEERQLRVAQDESEARLRFDTQIARLTHQIEFAKDRLDNFKTRLSSYNQIINSERQNQSRLKAERSQVEADILKMKENVKASKRELADLQAASDITAGDVETARRKTAKAFRMVDEKRKEMVLQNVAIEQLGVERLAQYRKCRLDEIDLPLLHGDLDAIPMHEASKDDQAMQVDEADDRDSPIVPHELDDYGIEVDFDDVPEEQRLLGRVDHLTEMTSSINRISADLERMAPNMKAVDRLDDVEAKLLESDRLAEKSRQETRKARETFADIKSKRVELFNKAFNHISDNIDRIYKELTKGKTSPTGGFAYMSIEDSEEPYNAGVKYHAMPPMKRFRDMEQLSGGEKTVAALALLFAIHSYRPAPFFVLDEVDAALDNTNVSKIANYIRRHASDSFQFVVISLKGSLYERGDSLVGIYRDQDVNSSKTLVLELSNYAD